MKSILLKSIPCGNGFATIQARPAGPRATLWRKPDMLGSMFEQNLKQQLSTLRSTQIPLIITKPLSSVTKSVTLIRELTVRTAKDLEHLQSRFCFGKQSLCLMVLFGDQINPVTKLLHFSIGFRSPGWHARWMVVGTLTGIEKTFIFGSLTHWAGGCCPCAFSRWFMMRVKASSMCSMRCSK